MFRLLATIHYPRHGASTSCWRNLDPDQCNVVIRAMLNLRKQPSFAGLRFEFTMLPMEGGR